MIFWTTLAKPLGLPLVAVAWLALFWISIRLPPRHTCLAVFLTCAIAVSGGIIAHPTGSVLSNQLFGDEILISLFAPIFLLFAAVAGERRRSVYELAARVAELDELTKKLSAEDRAKNEFIAVLAHELRNPLAPIMTTFELLALRGEPDPAMAKLVGGAQAQAFTMRRLLDDLLDVARISQGKISLIKETADLRSIIESSVESTSGIMRERRHLLEVALPESGVPVEADPVRLEQVFVNLLNNAAKYTHDGGAIEVSCAADGTHATVRLCDNGVGIEPADLHRIFLPFRQTGAAPHTQNGLGIGLWLTKRLIEMHGGEITALSEGKGRGSTFIVRLPLSYSEAA